MVWRRGVRVVPRGFDESVRGWGWIFGKGEGDGRVVVFEGERFAGFGGGGERGGGGGVDDGPEGGVVKIFVVHWVGDWGCHLVLRERERERN